MRAGIAVEQVFKPPSCPKSAGLTSLYGDNFDPATRFPRNLRADFTHYSVNINRDRNL